MLSWLSRPITVWCGARQHYSSQASCAGVPSDSGSEGNETAFCLVEKYAGQTKTENRNNSSSLLPITNDLAVLAILSRLRHNIADHSPTAAGPVRARAVALSSSLDIQHGASAPSQSVIRYTNEKQITKRI